jgi:hypothetical protein
MKSLYCDWQPTFVMRCSGRAAHTRWDRIERVHAHRHACERREPDEWQRVDRELVAIARKRGELDAAEARCLREAERLQLWRHLGLPSMLAYLEERLGYAPRTAFDRLRVARALGALPELEKVLENGDVSYSAARELSRVATGETEHDWIAKIAGKNLRQVEQMVRGQRKGARPGDEPDPELEPKRVTFELSPATLALLRQTQAALADEHGGRLDDDPLIGVLCRRALEGNAAEPTVARHQVAVTICSRCERGWQDGAGVVIEIDRPAIEIALCDAQHIGSLDAAEPERATQDVSPATRRFVWRRDHGRCQVPGCRSARNLDIHHIVPRAAGGGHDASNLTVLCSACHDALHRGLISITGRAPDLTVTRRAVAQPSKFEAATLRCQVRDALVGLGYRANQILEIVDETIAHVGSDAALEAVLLEALRRCPKPRSG